MIEKKKYKKKNIIIGIFNRSLTDGDASHILRCTDREAGHQEQDHCNSCVLHVARGVNERL